MYLNQTIIAVIPAAGIGSRMQASIPKQYLSLAGKTMLEISVNKLLAVAAIDAIVIAIAENDVWFANSSLVNNPKIKTVIGGKERVDSVLAAINSLANLQNTWVMVHDAARPCVTVADIENLLNHCISTEQGGLLAQKTRDTIKKSLDGSTVTTTENRELLWQALTPQLFPAPQLKLAIEQGLQQKISITDESSAMEAAGFVSQLIAGRSDNIKVTQAEDLPLAEFILTQQEALKCE